MEILSGNVFLDVNARDTTVCTVNGTCLF